MNSRQESGAGEGAIKAGMRLLRLREEDGGFSTWGMVVALMLSLVLVFSGFRVYRVQTVSAGIQDVADVAALAAENQVATFVSVARICDAAVLSFSLAGIVVGLIGVAALCVPATAPYSEGLLQAAQNIFEIRNTFSRYAAEGLDLYQKCLPFLAMSRACTVAVANNGADAAAYVAVAVLAPFEGLPLDLDDADEAAKEAQESLGDAQQSAESVRRQAEEAERMAKEADEIKRKAWELDCGAEGRCLRERASHLAGLGATSNPYYAHVDAWSFNVPLVRCRAYYRERLAAENPARYAGNPEMLADSRLRQRIYQYAVDEYAKAFARETEYGFECYFPLLPRNMAELRQTELYTEVAYPLRYLADGTMQMHACADCPGAAGCSARGSIAALEMSQRTVCPYCEFEPTSLASVCAATSVVNSGFEYYYRQIARLAEQYEVLRDETAEHAAPAKRKVCGLMETLTDLLKRLGGTRLEVRPPGSFGVIAIVANVSETEIGGPLSSGVLGGSTSLGARVAVSAATLVEDNSPGASSVIEGLPALLGFSASGAEGGIGVLAKVAGLFLSLWSGLIEAYNDGQTALERATEQALSGFSWQSSSGLGSWAVKALRGLLSKAGLQAAPVGFVKPVLVNTGLVAASDDSAFAQGFLAVKRTAPTVASAGEFIGDIRGLLSYAVSGAEGEQVPESGIVITIAQRLLDDDSPLRIVFTLLPGQESNGGAVEAWGWAIGMVLSAAGAARQIKDWR